MNYERIRKGLRIAERGGVIKTTPKIEVYQVTDYAGSGRTHEVTHYLYNDKYKCTCEDFEHHGDVEPCKHIRAVQIEEGENL